MALRVNGMGTYDFAVDTGSTVTLIDAGLAAEIGLRGERSGSLSSIAANQTQTLAPATIAVGQIAVRGVKVSIVKGLATGIFGKNVRGILGENFLELFEVLLDNENRRLTLDPDDRLTAHFEGERLPMALTTTFRGETITFRPTISATVPSYSAHPLKLSLDTGSNTLLIINHQIHMAGHSSVNAFATEVQDVQTVNGLVRCASWKDRVTLGMNTLDRMQLTSCPVLEEQDTDGSMPTFLFKRVLISHKGGYVLLNPEKRLSAPAEITSAR